ncbi:MAG TPA: hypothetical protein VEO02_05960 [Thermoanaerobaculia bacterium]|nr:hypothetical protein [Thermoanaerobaculia bacterium]
MRLQSRMLLVTGLFFWGGVVFAQKAPSQTPPPAVGGKKAIVSPQPPVVTRAEEPQKAPTTETAPQPVGFESDIYCFGYVGDLSESFSIRVTGAENLVEQTDFITDDFLYVSGGVDKGLKAGDEFWIVTPEQEIFHPVTGRSMGRLYQYRGRAVVHSVEARAGAVRVTNACTDIPIGSYLKPFEPVPIPMARKSPPAILGDLPSGKPRGRIVFTRDGVVALGTDNVVIVDLGAASGVAPGDFLTIFRYLGGEEFGIRPIGSYWVNLPPAAGITVPRTYLGEASVMVVGDRWAIARLTDASRLIQVGDEVELK